MGSSKKHKEKKERKKHKKHRSRSRERDSHHRSHKSSHRKEKKKSLVENSPENEFEIPKERKSKALEAIAAYGDLTIHIKTEKEPSPELVKEPSPAPVEDDFDIDKLLDSKLSEKIDIPIVRKSKKRIREGILEELRKRQNLSQPAETSDKFGLGLQQQVVETAIKPLHAPPQETPILTRSLEIPFFAASFPPPPSVVVKEEPQPKKVPQLVIQELIEERTEPKESLSINETNKLRLKLGLKPLEVEKEEPERSEPQLSLSINETNKLRAKLGLKPLDVGSESGIPGLTQENAGNEIPKPTEVFVKTENIREVKKSEALREKLKVTKEKRKIEAKLRKTKTVAESDSEDESAADWVLKHKKISEEKDRAEKRAKLLEEMDEEFGIGALVEEEMQKSKNQSYTSQHLKGLTIGHDADAFKEGTPIILTLKDKGVLEEDEDVLENVNIVDSEKYARNIENKKKKPDYQPYEEPEFDEFGILKKKSMLSKYDEEIEGEKKKSFKIGVNVTSSSHSTREQELELIRMKLKQQNKISLEMPELKVTSEYYTPQDMVQFKKPKKKKRKIRKQAALKADDLMTDTLDDGERDFGSRRRKRETHDETYSTDVLDDIEELLKNEDVKDEVIDEDQTEKEFYNALKKAKKLKERKIMSSAPEKVIEILNQTGASGSDPKKDSKVNIEMNSVAEFCRTLGEIPTYGLSGNRDEEANDMQDLERDLLEEKQKMDLDAQNRGAWNEVDIDEKPAEISIRENEPILEEEPDINTGVAGALNLATKKGYLDKESKKYGGSSKASNLQAQSYTIEEKFYEDDKFGKRDRYTGPTQDFREKSNYKPDVKLEYIDDSGRLLTSKEAFRYLSHKFHGKGPGKNKVDKRMKKLDQDNRLKQMSSTDTPLNTVKLLQAKQKETQSPYIVLSGGNKTLTQTMISKTKL